MRALVPSRTGYGMGVLREVSGADACLQCHKCTGGCPVGEHMDVPPSGIVRLIQLGDAEGLSALDGMWLCTSCQTCTTRCPAGVDLAAAQAMLREGKAGKPRMPGAEHVVAFDEAVLDSVRRHGRLHELAVARRAKARSGVSVQDIRLGLALFRRGKRRVRPARVGDVGEVARELDIWRAGHERGG